jgi:hypothetical protein
MDSELARKQYAPNSKVKLGYAPLLLSAVPPSRSSVRRDAASSSDDSGAVSRAGVEAAAPPPHAARGVWSEATRTPPPPQGVGNFGFLFCVQFGQPLVVLA